METHQPFENLTILIFSVVSFFICTAQFFLRKKINFLTLCKVSIFIPILSVIIVALWGISFALVDLSTANDISPAIIHKGVSILLVSISIGLTATILLAVYYAVTKAIFENQKNS
jgi:hypothetical protein